MEPIAPRLLGLAFWPLDLALPEDGNHTNFWDGPIDYQGELFHYNRSSTIEIGYASENQRHQPTHHSTEYSISFPMRSVTDGQGRVAMIAPGHVADCRCCP